MLEIERRWRVLPSQQIEDLIKGKEKSLLNQGYIIANKGQFNISLEEDAGKITFSWSNREVTFPVAADFVHVLKENISQFDDSDLVVRVRAQSTVFPAADSTSDNTEGFITIKLKTELSAIGQLELEKNIDYSFAQELLKEASHSLTKYRVYLDDEKDVTLDVFSHRTAAPDSLTGKMILETEFKSDAAANAYIPPSWAGKELTGKKEYSNASLAKKGWPAE